MAELEQQEAGGVYGRRRGQNLRAQVFIPEVGLLCTVPPLLMDILVTESEFVRLKEEEFHSISSLFASVPCVDSNETFLGEDSVPSRERFQCGMRPLLDYWVLVMLVHS